jgi:MOSC domain-containing protein YiiM
MVGVVDVKHATLEALEARLSEIRLAPKDGGELAMIVRRPDVGAREVLTDGWLDADHGLVGDTWKARASRRAGSGATQVDMQLNLMNSRAIEALAGGRERWPLAGDQLFVDLDLSDHNLPPGTRLAIGDAVIEVTAEPHTGCGKFSAHFGVDATKFVNSQAGRSLNLRGVNARVMQAGRVRVGDLVHKVH